MAKIAALFLRDRVFAVERQSGRVSLALKPRSPLMPLLANQTFDMLIEVADRVLHRARVPVRVTVDEGGPLHDVWLVGQSPCALLSHW